MTQLLNSFGGFHFLKDEGIKDGEDVLTIGKDLFDGRLDPGIAHRVTLPALDDLRRDIYVLAKLLERVPTQEEAVEEDRFVLRLTELGIKRKSHTLLDGKTIALEVKQNRRRPIQNKDTS